MLIAIHFRNFLSFKDETSLSMLSHRADKTLRSSLISTKISKRKSVNLLPVVAIYGANSSGKTNVLRAIDYSRDAVLNSQNRWSPGGHNKYVGFGSDPLQPKEGSIEFEFVIDAIHYCYGFSSVSGVYSDEYLSIYPINSKNLLFSRKLRNSDVLLKAANGEKVSLDYSIAFRPDFGAEDFLQPIARRTRQNSLFVSSAAQDEHPLCLAIQNWFSAIQIDNVSITQDRSHSMDTAESILRDPAGKAAIMDLLRAAEPHLLDIEIVEGGFASRLPPVADLFNDEYKQRFIKDYRYDVNFLVSSGEDRLILPLEVQSRGFRKLFALSARIASILRIGGIFVIDEIETSIHPHLARFIVDLFQNPEINSSKSQLIFTTHDTNILDQNLLRRDQIWFVEKNDCCSDLYSLLEFSPRKDDNIGRGYLRGRYGAIPALGMGSGWHSGKLIEKTSKGLADA